MQHELFTILSEFIRHINAWQWKWPFQHACRINCSVICLEFVVSFFTKWNLEQCAVDDTLQSYKNANWAAKMFDGKIGKWDTSQFKYRKYRWSWTFKLYPKCWSDNQKYIPILGKCISFLYVLFDFLLFVWLCVPLCDSARNSVPACFDLAFRPWSVQSIGTQQQWKYWNLLMHLTPIQCRCRHILQPQFARRLNRPNNVSVRAVCVCVWASIMSKLQYAANNSIISFRRGDQDFAVSVHEAKREEETHIYYVHKLERLFSLISSFTWRTRQWTEFAACLGWNCELKTVHDSQQMVCLCVRCRQIKSKLLSKKLFSHSRFDFV